MKIFIMLFLILFLTASHNIKEIPPGKIQTDRQYIKRIMRPYRVRYKQRIEDCLLYYGYTYDIPIEIFTRLAEAESGFRYYKRNKYSKCVGLLQVSPTYWSHLPYHHRGGKYRKLLKMHRGTNIIKVMKFIGCNVDMGGHILSTYYKRHGSYEKALVHYGGFAGKYSYRTNLMREYVSKVLVDYAD